MEKATCYPRTELTFKLIGLQRYLDIDAKWMNDQGMQWDFPTLLREEMRQPVRTAACGGTHRLGGLILTVKKRQRSGQPVDGEYAAAAEVRRQLRELRLPAAEQRRQLQHRVVQGPRRRGRHRPPAQDHGPPAGVPDLRLERERPHELPHGAGGQLPVEHHVGQPRPRLGSRAAGARHSLAGAVRPAGVRPVRRGAGDRRRSRAASRSAPIRSTSLRVRHVDTISCESRRSRCASGRATVRTRRTRSS